MSYFLNCFCAIVQSAVRGGIWGCLHVLCVSFSTVLLFNTFLCIFFKLYEIVFTSQTKGLFLLLDTPERNA